MLALRVGTRLSTSRSPEVVRPSAADPEMELVDLLTANATYTRRDHTASVFNFCMQTTEPVFFWNSKVHCILLACVLRYDTKEEFNMDSK